MYYLQANTTTEIDYNTSTSNAQCFTDKTTCDLGIECGGPGKIRKTMTIEEESGGPDDYHLKVILSYDGVNVESPLTYSTYKLKGKTMLFLTYMI